MSIDPANLWFLSNPGVIAPAPTEPSTFGSLKLWYDATSSLNIINTNKFATLKGLASGFDLTQTNTAQQPSSTETFNSLRVIDFDGNASPANDQLTNSQSTSYLSNNTGVDFWFVGKLDALSNYIVWRVDLLNFFRFEISFVGADMQIRGARVTSGATSLVSTGSAGQPVPGKITTNYAIYRVKWDTTTANIKIYKNNVMLQNTAFGTTGNFGANNTVLLSLGGFLQFSPLNGKIGEILSYETVSNENAVYNYLLNKWFTTALKDGSNNPILDTNFDFTY